MDWLGWRTIWNAFTAFSASVLVILLTSASLEVVVSWALGVAIGAFSAGTLRWVAGSYARTAVLMSSGGGTSRSGAAYRGLLLAARFTVIGLLLWLALQWPPLSLIPFALGLAAFQASVTLLFILRHLMGMASSGGNAAVGK